MCTLSKVIYPWMCEVIPEQLLGEILRLLFSRYNAIVRPSLQGPEGDNQYISLGPQVTIMRGMSQDEFDCVCMGWT